jgi:peptidoglycan/LPS O-acetylase OafA/YrhL
MEALVYLPSPYLIFALLAPCFGILIWYSIRYSKRRKGDERSATRGAIAQVVLATATLILFGPVWVGPNWWPWLLAGGVLIGGYALYRFREVRRQLCGALEIVIGIWIAAGQLVVVLTNKRGDPKAVTAVSALLLALSICLLGFGNWNWKQKDEETRPR